MTTIGKKTRAKTKRRGNNEGSIYQRSDGRWVGSFSIGKDAKGKRIRKVVYGWTKAEAQDELTRLHTENRTSPLTAPNRQTVATFLTSWLEGTSKPTIAATTHANYKASIDLHIIPGIGGIVLAKLSALQVQGLYSARERDGESAYTIRTCHAVLRKALKQAVRWREIPRNVCEDVESPRLPATDIHPLTADQVASLLDAAKGDRLEALYRLAVGSGLRLGELFGLQWADIDLAAASLTVRHSQTELKGILTLNEPKTSKSRRRVDLPPSVVSALHEHRKKALAAGHAGADRVFCNQHGTPLRRSHFHRQDFKALLKKAGLPSIRFHDLRHTFATLMFSQGHHPKVVQSALGHSQIGVTMDVYSHCLPSMGAAAASRLDELLTAKPEAKQKSTGKGA